MPDAVLSQFANNPEDTDLNELFSGPSFDADGVGLALSGGGYKAAAYHLGALIRLNELGWLRKIKRISSVSGGSIAAGLLGLKWKDLQFDAGGVATNFAAAYVDPLQDFLTEVNIDIPQILLGWVNPFSTAADGVSKAYDKHLFKGATLQNLPADANGPRFVLVATNYELNSLWRFSRPLAADHRVGIINNPTFSLADIVAASSAFPPFFCPIKLEFGGQVVQSAAGADRHSGDFLKRALLCDGGIYDNMGLEPIWKRYGTLLVSNAGDHFDEEHHPTDYAQILLRIISMMHRQAENNRQRMLMLLTLTGMRKLGYWPLRNNGSEYPSVPSPLAMDPKEIALAQEEKVRLWSLGAKAFNRLANHGYRMSDLAMRAYLDPAGAPPAKLPY